MKVSSLYPQTESEICPQIKYSIRAAIRNLDAAGSTMTADYWVAELHNVDGSPIPHRWNSGTLARIESDVMQALIADDCI